MPDRFARLLHPLFLAALAALVVNDHVLKAAAPGVVTGKLSDLAGLVVLPVLACAAWNVASRRRAWAVHAAVGAAFAAFQWVPSGAVVGAGAALGLRLTHTPDPTDLLALAVLPVGVRLACAERVSWPPRPRRTLARAVCAASVLAVLGTSQLPPEVLVAGPVLRAPTGGAALDELDRRLREVGIRAADTDSLTEQETAAAIAADVDSARASDAAYVRDYVARWTAYLDSLSVATRDQGRRSYDAYLDQRPRAPHPAYVRMETQWDSLSQILSVEVYDPAQWNQDTGFDTPWWRRREPAFRELALDRLLWPLQDADLRGDYWPRED